VLGVVADPKIHPSRGVKKIIKYNDNFLLMFSLYIIFLL
jgi:hypothetical protein